MISEEQYEENKNIISDLIKFHLEWNKKPEIKNSIIYFTLREISLFIEALIDGRNTLSPYEIILIIYGSKYPDNELYKLKNLLKEYNSFQIVEKNNYKNYHQKKRKEKTNLSVNSTNLFEKFRYKEVFINYKEEEEKKDDVIEFENCFENKSLKRAYQAIKFAFKYGKNVLILGNQGVGKTQLALWMAEYYDSKYRKILNEKKEKDVYICVCNETLKCSDLIGRQKPVEDLNNKTGELIKWENGFVVDGLIKGKCVILDRIEKAQATVTERLNNLLDTNYMHDTEYFSIPENPELKDGVKIDPYFRIIATADKDGINNMSPAFINRFIIVNLDDQLSYIEKGDIKSFCNIILDKININEEPKKRKNSDDSDRPNFMDEENSFGSQNEEKEDLNEDIKEKISTNVETIFYEYKNDINIYKLSKLCRIIGILINKYGYRFMNDIIDIAKFLTISENKKLQLNDDLKMKIIEEFPTEVSLNEEETFFFRGLNELEDFFALLFICFITHTHICIEGKTGIGKTACAKAFAEILKTNKYYIDEYKIFSFNNETVYNDFYGSLTLDENKNISFCNGVLTEASLSKDIYIFIADELNLASEETMNSLSPVLEEDFKYKIYIPGLSNRGKINNQFLFISCQNLSNTLGRKKYTSLLKSRLKKISYPEQNLLINKITDFENICIDVNNNLKDKISNKINGITYDEAKKLGKFILKFNEKNEGLIYNLNFRDAKKILKRIYYQKENNLYYEGFNIYNNILFYILSQTKEKDKIAVSKYIIKLLSEIFYENNYDDDIYFNDGYNFNNKNKISEKIKLELEECFNAEAEFVEEKEKIYLSKGKCKINVDSILTKNDKKNILQYNKLSTFLESLFLAKLSLNDEPLLILGDSGYKTYLAEKLLTNKFTTINLNSEIKLNYLLGSSMFYNKKEAGDFYLKNFFNII